MRMCRFAFRRRRLFVIASDARADEVNAPTGGYLLVDGADCFKCAQFCTFGPELVFKGIPDDLPPNLSPVSGYQFFGVMSIDAQSQKLTVSHINREGDVLWSKVLKPEKQRAAQQYQQSL